MQQRAAHSAISFDDIDLSHVNIGETSHRRAEDARGQLAEFECALVGESAPGYEVSAPPVSRGWPEATFAVRNSSLTWSRACLQPRGGGFTCIPRFGRLWRAIDDRFCWCSQIRKAGRFRAQSRRNSVGEVSLLR